MTRFPAAIPAVLLFVATWTTAGEPQQFTADDFEYFERKIRPLLSERCFSCHSAQADIVHGGLRLDVPESVRQGGDSGPVLVAGQPDASLLIRAIRQDGDLQMPPAGKMPAAEIAELTAWVARGAPFPATTADSLVRDAGIDFDTGRQFWSFQPASEQPLPAVARADWPRNRIDVFVLAALEREGLQPAARADRATLIRRATFDLIGLPPTPEQVHAFVIDASPDAFERLVDRLLQSPRYGERWARWWLDMARYTDRTASWLESTGEAHLYRDWVVRAMNDDLPYDAFVHRQLATDLMPETGPEDLPALGFLSLSPTYWKELKLPCEIIKVIVADEWEERVDAVSRTFLGLTVACARCHDHKFDPISSEDYYALAGVFASCRQAGRPLMSDAEYEPVRKAKAEVSTLEKKIAELRKTKPPPQAEIDELSRQIDQWKASTPRYDAPLATALVEESLYVERAGEAAQDGTRLEYRPGPRDLPLFVRGDPNRPGPVVQRRFLTVLSDKPRPFANGSGRFELARSITDDARPLAARVIVNRAWLAHFGQGLVDTPSNFGRQGSRPSHPELLDDLAARFVAGGWSLKNLHRELLLSATWQQTSNVSDQQLQADPDNRWLSRMNRRRLDFECWRDAMLAAGGMHDLSLGGPSRDLEDSGNRRRTLYATIHRRDMSTTMQIHDVPAPTQHSARRLQTVTALQGLFALNGRLLATQAQGLAERLDAERLADDRARVERAYWLLFSRAPTKRERTLGLAFLQDAAGAEKSARWQQYAHALLVSNEFQFVD